MPKPKRSLTEPGVVDSLISRLQSVQPDSRRRWGSMTPHEMLCHVADSYDAVMGGRSVSSAESLLMKTVGKWVALHTPLPWPPGAPTRPEVNPRLKGTPPGDFERDRARAIGLLTQFVKPGTGFAMHPAFGTMTHKEWMIWGFAHADHHLRQFGC